MPRLHSAFAIDGHNYLRLRKFLFHWIYVSRISDIPARQHFHFRNFHYKLMAKIVQIWRIFIDVGAKPKRIEEAEKDEATPGYIMVICNGSTIITTI